MRDLAPEGEPYGGEATLELAGAERGVDYRLDALAGRRGVAQPDGGAACELAGEMPQGSLEEPILVAEIERDEAGGDIGPARDLGNGRGVEAKLADRLDRRFDQLAAAHILRIDAAETGGAVGRTQRGCGHAETIF